MRLSLSVAAVLLALAATGCYREPVAINTDPPPSIPVTDLSSLRPSVALTQPPLPTPTQLPTPTTLPTPAGEPTPIDLTPTATPEPNTTPDYSPGPVASPTSGCVNGWVVLEPGTVEADEALAILGAQMGVAGPWTVYEMRYFTGPERPFVEPAYPSVERWYVRAALTDDPTFRARWLLERRTDLIVGISAVAPFESFGYESPDWTGFVGEGTPTSYLGLPGEWVGIPYDFVTGEGDSGQPGLPDEVVGCLAGT